jgi:hypothetical protein
VPLAEKVANVSEPLSKLVDQLLAKNPADRPRSAKDVAKELKRIESLLKNPEQAADARPHTAIAIEATENAWAGLDTESPSATPSHSGRLEPAKKKWLLAAWLGGTFLVVAIVVGFTLMVYNRSKTPVAEPAKPKPKADAKAEPKEPPDPFKPIFDGQSLAGWIPAKDRGTARFRAENGLLIADEKGGPDELLLTQSEYAGFELELEYRWTGTSGDAGVFLFLNEHAMGGGLELQLLLEEGMIRNPLRSRHGTLGRREPGSQNARPAGEWNRLRIVAANGQVAIEENGKLVNNLDFNQLAEKKLFRDRMPGLLEGRGHLALQCKSGGIEFRNIRIKAE